MDIKKGYWMEKIILKEAVISDARAIKNFSSLSYGEKVLTPSILGNNISIIATCHGNVAGFVICQFLKKSELKYSYKQVNNNEEVLYITTCYVSDKYKKQKLIMMMLREAMRRFGKNRKILIPV